MLPTRHWHHMTTEDIRGADTSRWIAVLPLAAIEQHGPHLPLGTDLVIAEGQVARVIELLPRDCPVTFLPVQAVGKSNEHAGFPGTLTLSWETATRAWIEIGESLATSGIRKLVMVSSHGGNMAVLDTVALELRARFGILAVVTRWGRFGQPEGVFSAEEISVGIHGGDIETSLMLHLAPELVRLEQAADFHSAQGTLNARYRHLRAHGPHGFGWLSSDLNPAGVVGDAAAASADKGRASLDHAAWGFVELLQEIETYSLDPDAAWP